MIINRILGEAVEVSFYICIMLIGININMKLGIHLYLTCLGVILFIAKPLNPDIYAEICEIESRTLASLKKMLDSINGKK